MSLASMIAEMRGVIPNYSALLARTHIQNAWRDVRNLRGWSFQLGNGGFSTPGLVSQGTCAVALGGTTVVGDAAASAVWATASNPASLITQRQWRIGAGTIYNIVAYGGSGSILSAAPATPGSGQTPGTYTYAILDATGPGVGGSVRIVVNAGGTVTSTPVILAAGVGYKNPYIAFSQGGTPATFLFAQYGQLTLDRPYIDTTYGTGLGYSIYGCYYVVPVSDFEAWESIRDVNNVIWLNVDPTRKGSEKINQADPQRQIFAQPISVIPYGTDQRTGSSTAGWMVYEMYPQPQAQYAYQTWYTRSGADLVLPTDVPPFPITEHVLKVLARVKAYEWAEANKDPLNPRGSGADYRFLMGAAQAEAKAQLKELRSMDRDRVDMWYSAMTRQVATGVVSTFNPSTGMVNSRNM